MRPVVRVVSASVSGLPIRLPQGGCGSGCGGLRRHRGTSRVGAIRTHRYGLRDTVPCGTVIRQEPRGKILREAAEVDAVEEVGAYVVERSGSRRSSVERREEILEVALSVLSERGYRGASMLEIARHAQASKETLYAWFGGKRGLFEEVVRWQAELVEAAIAPNLERDVDDTEAVLRSFALELQRLLLGDRAVMINRAAI